LIYGKNLVQNMIKINVIKLHDIKKSLCFDALKFNARSFDIHMPFM